jgi:hypothetical protein
VLGINQRYLNSIKYSVEMFSAYVQEVNFKIFKILIYFTYVSVSDPTYAQEIPPSEFAELCLGMVMSAT